MANQPNSYCTRGRNAIFFTADGILAAALLLLALLVLPRFLATQPTLAPVSLLAQDAVSVLAELRTDELGIITGLTGNLSNQTVLEQVAEFWAQNRTADARLVLNAALGGLIEEFGVYADGEELLVNGTPKQTLASAKRMVSGITKGRAEHGFNARAIARKIRKTTTAVFDFNPEGSGNQGGGGVDIRKDFNITGQIVDAELYVSIHYGTSDIKSTKIKVNGQDLGLDKDDWLYLEDSNLTEDTKVAFTKADVTSLLQAGANTITFKLKSEKSGNAHLHPGTRLEVVQTAASQHDVKSDITERLFFDDIRSHETGHQHSGAWAVMPVTVPVGATLLNATFHLHALDIEPLTLAQVLSAATGNCTGLDLTHAFNLRVYLNNQTIEETNNPLWLVNETVDRTYDLAQYLVPGTNVLSVYLNMYGDCFWGDGDTILFSSPLNDTAGSSSVLLTYVRTPWEGEYGTIDITQTSQFNTSRGSQVAVTKYVNGTVLQSAIELATLDNQHMLASVNNTVFFETPRPYATPTAIAVDNRAVNAPGNTTFVLQDCNVCTILPESSYKYTFLVPNFVGYGATFDTMDQAIEDAINRLRAAVGSAVTLLDIRNETLGIGNIPSMWGPTMMEVRAWR
ncbi:hypothetical protein HY642_04610 [Candidatus Woesearchaeota archaeon]|nr:hypothetical protein [Candidatus Woesearchaeota archaeon]